MASVLFATPSFRTTLRLKAEIEEWAAYMSSTLCLDGSECSIVADCPWLDAARSLLLAKFCAGAFDALLFRDDDVDFEAELLERMLLDLRHRPIVVAPYRMRMRPHAWAVTFEGAHLVAAGLGATLIRRDAIDKMIVSFPELAYDQDGSPRHALFLHELWQGKLLKEDHAFFSRARRAGLDLYAIPNARVDHAGVVSFWEGTP
jgi:hypothetical protein